MFTLQQDVQIFIETHTTGRWFVTPRLREALRAAIGGGGDAMDLLDDGRCGSKRRLGIIILNR